MYDDDTNTVTIIAQVSRNLNQNYSNFTLISKEEIIG